MSKKILNLPIKIIVFLSFILILTTCTSEKKVFTYENPIIPGFNPDPSICRVGDDYYLVANSSEYFPGIPIYHSRDLVNWEMISHVFNRPSQLNLDSVESSRGIFAPTIRYNNGTFYVLSTLVGALEGQPQGNFIATAQDPRGPWSEPQWLTDAQGIDPSLFFDDNGKVYYQGNYTPLNKVWNNHRNIWIQEIDLKNMKLIGERVDILNAADYYKKGTIDGGIEAGVDYFEAPHIYKKEGKYYLVVGHGGTFQNHAVSIWRSDNIFGPYLSNPSNPILTHRDLPSTFEITSVGHADLVQSKNGDWWMVYLGRRPYGGEIHILGREIFLSPVEWDGTWPVVNQNGKIGRTEKFQEKADLKEDKRHFISTKDDFENSLLDIEWTFLRTPRSTWWSLTDRPGFLRMLLRAEKISEIVNPSFIGKRQQLKNFSADVKMEFVPVNDKEEAGLILLRDSKNYYKYTITKENKTRVLRLIKSNNENPEEEITFRKEYNNNEIFLRIIAEGVNYTFNYSTNGLDWNTLADKEDCSFLGMPGAGRFTGTFIGMYATSNGDKGNNYVDFDWFNIESSN